MGLATIMPAWLAALLVCGVCLVIALIVALDGMHKFKKAMPLVPEDTLRGLKYDLGIAKEGSAFDPAVLDPIPSSTRPRRPPRTRPPPRRRPKRKPRPPPAGVRAAAERSRAPAPAGSAPHATSPGSGTNSTRNSTSSPRPRPCWPPPRSACRTARSSSAAKSPASAATGRQAKPRSVTLPASPRRNCQKAQPALETARRAYRLDGRAGVPAAQAGQGLGTR